MTLSLAQLADHLGAKLRGEGDVLINHVATLSDAGPGAVSFLSNARYRHQLAGCKASAIILDETDATQTPMAALIIAQPYLAYAKTVKLLHPREPLREGIHPLACVDADALVDSTAWIGAHSVIEANARIGAGTQVGPACIVGAGVRIGRDCDLIARVTVLASACLDDRVMLHPGVVIGSDGFGQARTETGWEKVPQIGSVQIADDVEIGANSCIDRGALGDTVIETGVRIDNQVQVAHNVFIGAHTAIAACVGISGSAKIGRFCTLAGGVGVVGHLTIADHVDITGMSMVTRSIDRAGSYS
ncbi:UDP-3-O-[3-hydroxymyristoyl] glucosamine N-acyltransferase, partial [hydrothermal vent metagenome]